MPTMMEMQVSVFSAASPYWALHSVPTVSFTSALRSTTCLCAPPPPPPGAAPSVATVQRPQASDSNHAGHTSSSSSYIVTDFLRNISTSRDVRTQPRQGFAVL